ncbi:ABC transporter permease subunit [Peribacillus sp. SCS-155]|uniref:ABC transporter permease subunit n=1 Tax=Peribacillus sedimenti TaxID=3115297 RepID=UPI003906B667
MKLIGKMAGSLLLWSLVAFVFTLIVLLPRENTSHYDKEYNFITDTGIDWETYKGNISNYWSSVAENKSLGMTKYEEPVEKEMVYYGWNSLKILVPAFILSVAAGISKGVFDYRHSSGKRRLLGRGLTSFGQSMPEFISIIFLQTAIFELSRRFFPKFDIYGDENWYSTILPTVFLAVYPVFVIARYTSEALDEENRMDYIKTARSKGIGEKAVLWKHALLNCLPKLIHHSMPIVMTLLSGMFVVEYLSLYKGIGYRIIKAINIDAALLPGYDMSIDTVAVIGFSLLFMSVLLVYQWTMQIISYFLLPVKGEEQL